MPSTQAAPDGAYAFDTEEAARFAGMSRAGLYRAAADGLLTARKLGGKTLWLRADLIALIDNLPPAPIRVRPGA